MSGRRKTKDRHRCPLAAALLGQCDEVAEQAASISLMTMRSRGRSAAIS